MADQSYNNYYLLQRVTLLSAQAMWHSMFHGNTKFSLFSWYLSYYSLLQKELSPTLLKPLGSIPKDWLNAQTININLTPFFLSFFNGL